MVRCWEEVYERRGVVDSSRDEKKVKQEKKAMDDAFKLYVEERMLKEMEIEGCKEMISGLVGS